MRRGMIDLRICGMLFLFISSLSHAGDNDSWKVVFFAAYVEGCDKQNPDTHQGFAEILNASFSQAGSFVLDHERELADKVGNQVDFFCTISNKADKDRELNKCLDGMKRLKSFWAKTVLSCVKARMFVAAFAGEHDKRIKESVGGK